MYQPSIQKKKKKFSRSIKFRSSKINSRRSLHFSGRKESQDPLKFLESFERLAKSNNWESDSRKKNGFLSCLVGDAERWVHDALHNPNTESKDIAYESESESKSLVSMFKKKYVTKKWKEYYLNQYETYYQQSTESPIDYCTKKQHLLKKADPDNSKFTEENQIKNLLDGLLPELKAVYKEYTYDPNYVSELQKNGSLKIFIKWAKQFTDQHFKRTTMSASMQGATIKTPTLQGCDAISKQLCTDDGHAKNTDCIKILNLLKDNILPNLNIVPFRLKWSAKPTSSSEKVDTDKENPVKQHTSPASSSSDPVIDSCDTVKIDWDMFGKCINDLFEQVVAYNDINIKKASENVCLDNFFTLLDNGNPLFDSLIYLEAPILMRECLPIVIKETDTDANPSNQETINSLLVIYALLLTKGTTDISEESVPKHREIQLRERSRITRKKSRSSTSPEMTDSFPSSSRLQN